MHHARAHPRGFTLIEVIIVLAILGITAMVVAPMVANQDDLRLASAGRKVLADLNYAQNMAIATQRTFFVRFDATGYDLATRPAPGAEPATITHPIDKSDYRVDTGAAADNAAMARVSLGTITIGSAATVLAFDSLGTPQAYDATTDTAVDLTNPATIQIQSGGQTVTLSVQPFTGEVTVQ